MAECNHDSRPECQDNSMSLSEHQTHPLLNECHIALHLTPSPPGSRPFQPSVHSPCNATMSSQDSTVLLVSLEKESFLDEIIGTLLTTLRAKATIIEAKSAIEVHEALQSNPTGVLVTDAAITDAKHRPTAHALAHYAQSGGTVVLGGLMSSFATPPDFDAMMKDVWKLSWKFGSYTRDEAHLAGAALAWKLVGATKVTLPLAIHLRRSGLQTWLKAIGSTRPSTKPRGKPLWRLRGVERGSLAGWAMSIARRSSMRCT